MTKITAYRGSIFHFKKLPKSAFDSESYQFIEDGILIVKNGKIESLTDYCNIDKKYLQKIKLIDYSGYVIMPGFIDAHIHYPQSEMIASFGEQLMEWLNNYVFPTERKFSSYEYSKKTSDFFLDTLLRNGTTTAMVFSTVHETSANALFESSKQRNMRMITGKVLMDRNAPDYLLDTPESSYIESKRLINKWHNRGRLSYALTPRFAATSTEAQLEIVSELKKEFPDTYLQTHLSENVDEVKFVKELYPWSRDYTNVYEKFDLLGEKSIFAHAIHLSDTEFQTLRDSNSIVTWCPTSNHFLGSGSFNLGKAKKYDLRVSIGTDVGGGSSFSMLQTLKSAYKTVAQQRLKLSALRSLYRATLGNAKALSLEDKIGNFELGKEADFIVVDMESTPFLKYRMKFTETLEDKLFCLCILGDDRNIKATYIYGNLMHTKDGECN